MKRHLRPFLLILCGITLVSGCISQERTPYHEISFAEENRQELDFFWPLYMGDGRAHYALWPLIKKSPGCFTAFPFYNYDHGIHDVGLLATNSSNDKETRILPFWFQDRHGWLLLPLAYYLSDEGGIATGSPLLFNYLKEGDTSFVQSLLYYSENSPKKSRTLFFPFVSYYSEKDKEDYSLWTPLFRRGVETNSYSDLKNEQVIHSKRTFWNRNSLLSLYGFTHDQSWKGTKENPRETCITDKSKAWAFPFYWNWEDHLKGERNDLLFPLFFRTIDQRDAPGTWATPLFGWAADHSWWHALNCGRYHSARWCLPFAYWNFEANEDGSTTRDLWMPLGYLNTTRLKDGKTNVRHWGVGPLLPLLANGNEREFKLLGGLLWFRKNTPLNMAPSKFRRHRAQCDICMPRDTDTRYESTRSNLLLGTLYGYKRTREYEAESLIEKRPIYVEERNHDIGLFLWQQSKRALHGAEYLPKGATYPALTSERYSLLGGLWTTQNRLTQEVEHYTKSEKCKEARHWASEDYSQFKYETRSAEHTYGWILWKDESTTERDAKQNQRLSTYFRTPLFGLGKTHYHTAEGETFEGGDRFSLLLGLYGSQTDIRYDDYQNLNLAQSETKDIHQAKHLIGNFLWKWDRKTEIALSPNPEFKDLNPETPECERLLREKNDVLGGLLWNRHNSNYSHLRHGKSSNRDDWSSLLCGLLYRDDLRTNHEFTYCTAPDCLKEESHCPTVLRREETTTYIQFSLLGLLTFRDFRDTRVYERGDPEMLKVDLYKDDFRVLLGIPYLSSRTRNGTIKRRSLFGLLFDQEVAPAKKTSTFGILGFLYRYNQHADDTREQLIFPFIRTTSNDTTHAWSASFLGKFFKVERLPNGEMEWTLLWL
jgi:hypothetical protein